jgi:signal transduction histidine kinase
MGIEIDELILIIEDNGVGFDAKKLNYSNSLGLHVIQERMMQVGGTVEIEGGVGRGTVVVIRVPHSSDH